jgi:hypothetical protein
MSSKGKKKPQSPDLPLRGATYNPDKCLYVLKNRDEVYFSAQHQKWWNKSAVNWVSLKAFLGV